MENTYDFSGWATKNDLKCADGRIIRKGAFKACDGAKVPIVWNHQHKDVEQVLGHGILENRSEGVYVYGYLNGTNKAKDAKEQISHGDIVALSIFANELKEVGNEVLHGAIKEVSLVLAGSNPGAFIDSVNFAHSDDGESITEAIIYTGIGLELAHSDDNEQPKEEQPKEEQPKEEQPKEEQKNDDLNETVGDVLSTLSEKQQLAVSYLLGEQKDQIKDEKKNTSDNKNDNPKGGKDMKHNAFEGSGTENNNVFAHADATMPEIVKDGKRFGSLKEACIAHGIDNIDYLMPEATNLNSTPEFISRDTGWVSEFMGAVHHTPFSKIKSIFADITEDEARAKGYIKGNLKKEEVFTLLKRTTSPTTVYKKQKLDKDDYDDITNFDILLWLKAEMRIMLDEEIARACLVGDGRSSADEDKVKEDSIRPIWTDADLYTVKWLLTFASTATEEDRARAFVKGVIKARKNYKGSGNPTLYTTEDILTECLLLTDTTGRDLYDSVDKLCTKLRVKKIVTVEVMENLSRSVDGNTHNLMGILVNPFDYNIGADKGGAVNLFDGFDLDYNQMKYLLETRCSGALIKPYSAIAVEYKVTV